MVRIKRIRKRKLYLFTAACVSCVAVLMLLVVSLFFFIKGRISRINGNTAVPAAEAAGPEAEEAPGTGEQPVKLSDTDTGDGGGTAGGSVSDDVPDMPKVIDDDSKQDENSVVDSEPVIQGEGGKVYITFDDGPSVYTDEILDILKEYGVHATFFVCGTGDTDSSLKHVYKRIVDEGHTIGMHSYSHVYSRVYGDLDLFQYDLDKIRNLIYNETGVVPKYYRFPGGSGNTIASLPMDQYISVLYSQGMEYYDWNVYGGDSSGNRLSPAQIVKNTLDGVDRRNNAVVLLHDTGSRKNTVEALPGILKGLKERGLEIRAIDDDTPPLHQFSSATKTE